jgi:hypothetical protein
LRQTQLAYRDALNYLSRYAFEHGKLSNKVSLHDRVYQEIRAHFESTPQPSSASMCAQSIRATLTNGPTGRQYLYQARSIHLFPDGTSGGAGMVGEITWS